MFEQFLARSPTKTTLELDGLRIHLTRKPVKALRLRVRPDDGSVHLSVPLRTPEQNAHAFVRKHLDWIRRHQQTAALAGSSAEGSIRCLGRVYRLSILETTGRESVCEGPEGSTLEVRCKAGGGAGRHSALVERWRAARLLELALALKDRWEPVMGVRSTAWSVRSMRSRWGSCSTGTGRIRLSLALAACEPDLVEYVVVHELVHLLEPSHNARFHAFMTRFLPDWPARRARLRQGPASGGQGGA